MHFDLKKIKTLSRLTGERNKKTTIANISRDWRVLLAVFLAVNIFVFTFHISGFLNTKNSAMPMAHKKRTSTFNREALSDVLREYEQKQSAFDALVSGGTDSVNIIDPSE